MKCPKCKLEFKEYPAISRRDNKTKICSKCGVREAFEDYGLNKKETEKVIEATSKYRNYCFTCDEDFKTNILMEKHLASKKHKQAVKDNEGKGILD